MVTLANAGVHAAELSDLRTAVSVNGTDSSARWFGTSNSRPLSAAVNVHDGLPKLQVLLLLADGATPAVPSTVLPGVVCCRSHVTELLPEGMLKAAPAGQFTTMPVPVAVRVPVTPPV